MMQVLRESGKRTAGWLLSRSMPRYRYHHCIFILAHMRCGSTALSNILCSRPDISGYGEAHVCHDGPAALGRLAVNQMRRGGWRPQAHYLFDKILHSRHDCDVPTEFFEARAIFIVRRPEQAIASIVRLFTRLDRKEYETASEAAQYYVERLAALEGMWHRFPGFRRIGLTHEALLQDPDRALSAVSGRFGFSPPLENRYVSPPASRRGGGGDPLVSGRHTRIESRLAHPIQKNPVLDLPADLASEAEERYRRLSTLFHLDSSGSDTG